MLRAIVIDVRSLTVCSSVFSSSSSSSTIIMLFTLPAQASQWATRANTTHAAFEHTHATTTLTLQPAIAAGKVAHQVLCSRSKRRAAAMNV
jgi:hypothetical protein